MKPSMKELLEPFVGELLYIKLKDGVGWWDNARLLQMGAHVAGGDEDLILVERKGERFTVVITDIEGFSVFPEVGKRVRVFPEEDEV